MNFNLGQIAQGVTGVLGGFGIGTQPQPYLPPAPNPAPINYAPAYQPQTLPMMAPGMQAQPVMAARPLVQAVATGLREIPKWADAFPNLYQGLVRIAVAMERGGVKTSVAAVLKRLAAFARKWGPQVLMGVGILTAVEYTEFLLQQSQQKKRRRLNPGNVRALRRSLRRVEGFQRLSARVNRSLPRTKSRRRCSTCRANPCKC